MTTVEDIEKKYLQANQGFIISGSPLPEHVADINNMVSVVTAFRDALYEISGKQHNCKTPDFINCPVCIAIKYLWKLWFRDKV